MPGYLVLDRSLNVPNLLPNRSSILRTWRKLLQVCGHFARLFKTTSFKKNFSMRPSPSISTLEPTGYSAFKPLLPDNDGVFQRMSSSR